jgi:hypothetical protein
MFVMTLASVAVAQGGEPACTMGVTNLIGYSNQGGHERNPVAYTATVKTSFEQHLADGGTIQAYVITHQARDGAGRTRNEMAHGCRIDENGVAQAEINVAVYDPATKTGISWQMDGFPDKVARVSRRRTIHPISPPKDAGTRSVAPPPRQASHAEEKLEELGTRNIAGVEAHGTRNTRTIPPGEEGNDRPLVIVRETWFSKELKLTLLSITDDPRRGRTTYEVEELSRAEPDPSLFAPPEGYRIEEPAEPAETAVP